MSIPVDFVGAMLGGALMRVGMWGITRVARCLRPRQLPDESYRHEMTMNATSCPACGRWTGLGGGHCTCDECPAGHYHVTCDNRGCAFKFIMRDARDKE